MKNLVLNMKRIALIVVVLAAYGSSGAQVILPSKQSTSLRENVFGLGFFGGASGGIGLSFRHHLPSPLSYQITGGIIKIDGKLRSDIGAEIHYDLARGSGTRFFVAGGFGYYYSGTDGKNEMKSATRGGFGLGGEWVMSGGLHFLAEGMFTFFSDGNILPLPQIGFYYYFY
ncbi:hypothetical protein FBQ87_16475 [Sphingobacteriales bacterium CHB3]|nr:hypothetical protein [Sphingobacteriales bacterium CHB3]